MKDHFIIKGKRAKVDECYGLYEFEISLKDIMALLEGKKLYGTVGEDEYAITIKLGKEEADDQSDDDMDGDIDQCIGNRHSTGGAD